MNAKRILIAIVVAFFAITITDYLIHQVLLASSYAATPSRWRPAADMQAHMPWIFLGELVAAIGIALVWVKALADKATIYCALGYGVSLGLIYTGAQLMNYAVMPLPGSLILKWIATGVVQNVLVTLALFKFTKRATT
jgi:hypothetical protein